MSQLVCIALSQISEEKIVTLAKFVTELKFLLISCQIHCTCLLEATMLSE